MRINSEKSPNAVTAEALGENVVIALYNSNGDRIVERSFPIEGVFHCLRTGVSCVLDSGDSIEAMNDERGHMLRIVFEMPLGVTGHSNILLRADSVERLKVAIA